MLYVDAVVPEGDVPLEVVHWARPSMCLWMSDEVYARTGVVDREAWYVASRRGGARRRVESLEAEWGLGTVRRWYGDNTRETLRDETFPLWLDHGAMRVRSDLPTTTPVPRWALTEPFADLFDPSLSGEDLVRAIEEWRDSHMSPGDRFRIQTHRERERATHAVAVTLPNGRVRNLEPGAASHILRGVIEEWAPARLADPEVLSISEPGDKVYLADAERLRSLGLTIDPGTLLPDAVIVDIGARPPTFWIIEAVATDGPVTEDRRRQLLRWAHDQRIPVDSCRFLSAFLDRNDNAARRRLKDLAVGTFAWYASEPTRELSWQEISKTTQS